jgi:von Willebrand factor type A domain
VTFLSPLAGLVGVGVAAALAVLLFAEQRSRRLADVLGLVPRGPIEPAVAALAIVLVGVLVGLAAAQPVTSSVRPREGRTDAQAIVLLDISRSMLARERRGGPTRFERAVEDAKRLRAAIPDVPVGVASMTDRVLPHMFPTTSANAFTAVVDRTMGVERPPPDRAGRGRVTSFAAMSALATNNFFADEAQRRVAIVLTDGETVPLDLGTLRARMLGGRIATVIVRYWGPLDRVYGEGGVPERYRPDPASAATVEEVAEAVQGRVYASTELDSAVARVQSLLGDGPVGEQGQELQSTEWAPYALALAGVPLLFLLWRRNLATA